ncbi:MAG: M48 family metallopeptidase [Deltaproteobacteria bacterium]|nr:M48 family metallopeptidase [Deltaproteobacteria bacterium]
MLPMSRTAILSLALGLTLLAAACASAPYTGRRQLLFTSEGRETKMGYQAFEQIKRQYKLAGNPDTNALVTQVGRRIADAAQRPDYRWEFVVLEGKEANAFCLPGGKVGIFTGLLKYTKDEAGMATVISHEVAHALARHAGERLSQSMLAQAGGIGLGAALGGVGSLAGTAIMQGYSLGAQLGILLPYSRTQESEADRVGLILMAKAGYDPAQALEFWKRMMTTDKGGKLPQFMSSHPNDASRLRELQEFLPEARKYSVPAQEAQSPPPPGIPAATRPSLAPAAPAAGRWIPAP